MSHTPGARVPEVVTVFSLGSWSMYFFGFFSGNSFFSVNCLKYGKSSWSVYAGNFTPRTSTSTILSLITSTTSPSSLECITTTLSPIWNFILFLIYGEITDLYGKPCGPYYREFNHRGHKDIFTEGTRAYASFFLLRGTEGGVAGADAASLRSKPSVPLKR